MATITIEGVEFRRENRHTYVYFGKDGKQDVMLSQQDKHSWDVFVHEPDSADILDQYTGFGSKEQCVKWAKGKGYL